MVVTLRKVTGTNGRERKVSYCNVEIGTTYQYLTVSYEWIDY